MNRRLAKVNSLLVEVISEAIRRDVKDPRIPELISIISSDVSADLRHAEITVSVIGEPKFKRETIELLNELKKEIAFCAREKVSLRYFPHLRFILDESVDKQMRIEELLQDIHDEESNR
jgi:ribosome-binding factor A